MRRREPEPICCDGRCANGGECPAFAPGVIDGPYRRGQRCGGAWAVLAYPAGVFVALVAWLLGPAP